MKILFDDRFYNSAYADNGASVPGRMEAVLSELGGNRSFEIAGSRMANDEEILLAHTPAYVDSIRPNRKLYDMAALAAGTAVMAAEFAFSGEPAFACIRPPGHHASRNSSWDYCVFCNMGIALLALKQQKRICSAFVLDFDAHTGDGTKDVLSDWKECLILNPYADNRVEYLKEIEDYVRAIPAVDIVGVCAGFDSYERDVGRKLATADFYLIGDMMKRFSKRAANHRRFAILEGGYFLPDLGRNVLAFCQGFM
jgi:acetoin utilization deacetylase AcuC-like enzyme